MVHTAIASVGDQKMQRRLVWQATEKALRAGGYRDRAGGEHPLDVRPSLAVQRWPYSPDNRGVSRARVQAVVTVANCDCLVAAGHLARRGLNPLVADAGSRRHFGGGYQNGARAQEEELCRRTSLAMACDASLGVQSREVMARCYPLAPRDGIYVPAVHVFRHGASGGYDVMAEPFRCAVGIIAAYNRPDLDGSGQRIVGPAADDTRAMFTTLLHMAAANGHRSVVVVPVGCGAFRNPAAHVAVMLREILMEPGALFLSFFDEVVVSILEDHNSRHEYNPDGNFVPFARELAAVPGFRALDAYPPPQEVAAAAEAEAVAAAVAAAAADAPPATQPHKRRQPRLQ
jgi:uncharacterized protein (TIGR02452 family)